MRLVVYLVASYALAYLAHVPVHHGFSNALIPALVPWGVAGCVAIARFVSEKGFAPAWVTLAAVTAFFLLGHLVPH